MPATLVVVNGAILRCDKGASSSPLVATTGPLVRISSQTVATIIDNQPALNVLPFGLCAITQAPCVPVTPLPWIPGGLGVPTSSPFPILTKNSRLPCMIGGIIEVLNAGQTGVLVGAPAFSKVDVQGAVAATLAESGYAWSWGDFGFGLAWGFTTGKIEGNFILASRLMNERALKYRQAAKSLKLSPAAREKLIRDYRNSRAASGHMRMRAGRVLGPVGLIPDGVSVYRAARGGDYEAAAVKAGSAAAGYVAAGACTAAVVGGTSGLGTPLAVAGCGLVGAGVSSGSEWAYYKVAKPVGGAVADAGSAVGRAAKGAGNWAWKHRNPRDWF